MFCSMCRKYDRNEHQNQFVHGCSSMKVESVRKHELSQQHKAAEAAHRAHKHPERSPMEVAVQQMEREELEQVRRLFNIAFSLVEAEHPFSDFPGLLQLQKRYGLPLGCAYSNEKQAKTFVGFIAEELRSQLVKSLQEGGFFSVSFDSSTDQGNIDEEMVQVRVLENNRPVYKFVAVKPLAKADAASTVAAVVEALETDCELSDWQSKLVGLSADGAAVNMGVHLELQNGYGIKSHTL